MELFRRSVEVAGPDEIDRHIELLDPHGSYRLGNLRYYGGIEASWSPSDSLLPEEGMFLLDKTIRGPKSRVRTVEDFGRIYYSTEHTGSPFTGVLKGGLAHVSAEGLSQHVYLPSETYNVFDRGQFCVKAIALAVYRKIYGQEDLIDADRKLYQGYEEKEEPLILARRSRRLKFTDQMLKDWAKDG